MQIMEYIQLSAQCIYSKLYDKSYSIEGDCLTMKQYYDQ